MTSWLDLMGDDSNISMASMASLKSMSSIGGMDVCKDVNKDPEFDNSKQGMNLLFKKNIKFLATDDSQSRKRTFNQIQTNKTNDEDKFLPPKAKQRTNQKGQWKKRKNENENEKEKDNNKENENGTVNFERFLCKNTNANNSTTNTRKQYRGKRREIKRRVTPVLDNIVFNRDLIECHKVPILSPKQMTAEKPSAPIFLNADQFRERERQRTEREREAKERESKERESKERESKEKESKECKEEKEREEECSVWNGKAAESEPTKPEQETSWAKQLFSFEIEKNRLKSCAEEETLVNAKKRQILNEIRVNSILPILPASPTVQNSRQSSDDTVKSQQTKSETESEIREEIIIKPSSDATEWRQKQIKIGKDTIGYRNYIKKYTNKDRNKSKLANNDLMSTPDPQEKIGKKRWCGKYNKWRKWLHNFDILD